METKNVVAASLVGVAAVSFIGWQVLNDKDDKKVEQKNSAPISENNQIDTPKVSYKDGSYSAVGNYVSPGGNETVNISLDLSNGNISNLTFSESNKYWEKIFGDGVQQEVSGKNIEDVKLTIVNGSSLTSIGFMDALNKVKEQAKN